MRGKKVKGATMKCKKYQHNVNWRKGKVPSGFTDQRTMAVPGTAEGKIKHFVNRHRKVGESVMHGKRIRRNITLP